MELIFNKLPNVGGSDTIPLENCNKVLLKEVGRLIYNAARNDDEFRALRSNTAYKLEAAGVPAGSLKDMQFYLAKDDANLMHITVPEVKTPEELGASFDDYLVELGLVTLRACKRA